MRLTDSSRVTYGTKISDRIWEDSNGQLICRDAVLARTGSYDYLESEIIKGGDEKKVVKVFRTDEEVFDPISIASFENKPFVDDHPQEDVSPENFRELSKGYMRDVRRGEGELSNCLIGDIVVTDPDTIEEIKSGRKRELSLGYDTVIVKRDGKYLMTNIRGNHLALVSNGRAGCATIRDSATKLVKTGGVSMKKSKVTLFDEDVFEVEEIEENGADTVLPEGDAVEEEKPVVTEATDAEPTLKEVYDLLVEVKELLTAKPAAATDAEVPAEEPVVEPAGDDVLDDGEGVEAAEEGVPAEVPEGEDEGELLEADEVLAKQTKTDAKSVYSQFAKISDTRTNNIKNEVQEAFQNRYNAAAKKSY